MDEMIEQVDAWHHFDQSKDKEKLKLIHTYKDKDKENHIKLRYMYWTGNGMIETDEAKLQNCTWGQEPKVWRVVFFSFDNHQSFRSPLSMSPLTKTKTVLTNVNNTGYPGPRHPWRSWGPHRSSQSWGITNHQQHIINLIILIPLLLLLMMMNVEIFLVCTIWDLPYICNVLHMGNGLAF